MSHLLPINCQLSLLLNCLFAVPSRLEFDSDESLDEDDDKEKASTSTIASPVEQRKSDDMVGSLADKNYPIASSNDYPATLDHLPRKAQNQTDVEVETLRKDYLGNVKQEKQAGNRDEIKQSSCSQNPTSVINFLFCIFIYTLIQLPVF